MAVSKRKTRVISIRMYEEDFASLEAACRRSDSASLSELVRAALVDFVQSHDQKGPQALESIQVQLETLARKMDSLHGIVVNRELVGPMH